MNLGLPGRHGPPPELLASSTRHGGTYRRRRYSPAWATVVVVIAVLSACSGGGGGQRTGQAGTEPLPLDQQNLSVGYTADSLKSSYLGRFNPTALIFDTLTSVDDEFRLHPALAESWDVMTGSNIVRFHLRRDVTFHDGGHLTAVDVKASLDYFLRNRQTIILNLTPDGVTVVDPYTVDITPSTKDSRLPEELSHPANGIFKAGTDPTVEPMGTGPFRFIEYVPEQRLVVEGFPGYWDRQHLAKLNRLTFNFVPDAQTRFLGLRSGSSQVIAGVAPDATAELQAIPGAALERSVPSGHTRANFNIHGSAPYDLGQSTVIRKAVALSVDRNALVQRIYQDNATTSPLQPDLFGSLTERVKGLPYDPQQARQLLQQDGWSAGPDGVLAKGGRRLTLTYILGFGAGDAARLTGEVLQGQLKQVGIELKLDTNLDPATAQARSQNGEYDLVWGKGTQTSGDPCLLPSFFASAAIGGTPKNYWAPGGDVDQAILACRTAPTTQEAKEAAVQAEHLLIDIYNIDIPTGTVPEIWGASSRVRGFRASPILGMANWQDVYLTSD